jgi:hypothetical protein
MTRLRTIAWPSSSINEMVMDPFVQATSTHPPHSHRTSSDGTRLQGNEVLLATPITKLTNTPLKGAVTALNTLQSNFAIVDAIRKSGRGMNQQAIPEMIDWCRKIGYEVRPVS